MEIVRASLNHLEDTSRLFDQYRVFYQQSSDLEAAKQFLKERLENKDSVIFLAQSDDHAVGFTQLYPSFSSVAMKSIWILNYLFVKQDFRRQGVAQLLMNAAESFARANGAIRVVLATQHSNTGAQSLYKSRKYTRNEEFFYYALSL